jgi:rhamnose utilization protein RhaD (predicted bifunctional aldolase and dehydrogenase)/NAD(P)-dependent dehydrogenase (short-subunit alcohol dehydrogenase family)
MAREIRTHLFDHRSATPSIETLVHAFIQGKFVDHSHADAILALTNQKEGQQLVEEALGSDLVIVEYVKPGFELAKAVAEVSAANPDKKGMVWMKHGLVTWGETARESYEAHIRSVTLAEEFLAAKSSGLSNKEDVTSEEVAARRWTRLAPILRGLLAEETGIPDRPYQPVVLRALTDRDTLNFVDSEKGKKLALSPPLTADHLIRTKAFPMWVEDPAYDDEEVLKEQLEKAIEEFRSSYDSYLDRFWEGVEKGLRRFSSNPRAIVLPGLGVVCSGEDVVEADICKDIMAQTLDIKGKISGMGEYEGLTEEQIFAQEYRSLQHAKLGSSEQPLTGQVALVTGAAGAIGSGISKALADNGCNVALTDLPGDHLDSLVEELSTEFGNRILGVPLDVTQQDSVEKAFDTICATWGGIDLFVVNAGLALVSSLKEMKLEDFRRLERVNVEGTLLVLSAAASLFERQGTGGDVVMISTKNVFAPGANFGAYSATKAAGHQLSRIASLEMAALGVRVNMVSPDAVFGERERKSGLWAEVGPDRMRARGLDEEQLQDYYRTRNLLKSRVTAEHVANAVLFFATRQTPTTGATIPVDGGLPDSTPR